VANGKATEAPDKRFGAGAVPAATTIKSAKLIVRAGNYQCKLCMSGNPPIKMKRQWIHRVGHKNVICPEKGIKHMDEGSKRG